MDAQPRRLLVRPEPRQWIGGDDDAPAAIDRVDVDHPSGDRERAKPALQHRRLPLPCRLADQGKAGAEHGQRQRRLAQHGAPVQRERRRTGGERRGKTEPQRRLEVEGEINADPAAKKHRQPQQAALAFGGIGSRDSMEQARAPSRRRAEPFARDRRIRHRRPAVRARRS